MRTPAPETEYLQKLGQVVFLVAYVEGMLVHDLPRLRALIPGELNLMKVSGMTTRQMGDFFIKYGAKSTDSEVAAYLTAGGTVLVEIAMKRNGMLHARPAEDGDDADHPVRLLRWRVEEEKPDKSEVFVISHRWLDDFIDRLDDVVGELSALRPPLRCS